MKRLALLLALLFGALPSAYAQNPTKLCFTTNNSNCVPGLQASNSSAISVAAATTTQIVGLTANQAIYITSFDFMAAGTNNVTLVYGTAVACGTGTTSLTGAYPLIAQAGIAKGNGTGLILSVPRSNALCITTSGTGQLSGSVSYVKF